MIGRQVYNHQNYIQFGIFHASCCSIYFASSYSTAEQIYRIFYKPPNYYLSNKNFLTFIKLSCNKLISTRYLSYPISDISFLTITRKISKIICNAPHFSTIITSYESRLRSSKLLVHRSRTSVKQPPTRSF